MFLFWHLLLWSITWSFFFVFFTVGERLAPPFYPPPPLWYLSSCNPQSLSLSSSHVRAEHMASASLVTSVKLTHSDLLCAATLQRQCQGAGTLMERCGSDSMVVTAESLSYHIFFVFQPRLTKPCLPLIPASSCISLLSLVFRTLGNHSNGQQVARAFLHVCLRVCVCVWCMM